MARPKRNSPSWGKWWFDDWRTSTLRSDHLTTAAQRGIFRELWDLMMSSPEPGSAVDKAGNPRSTKALARQIGCRIDHLESVIETLLEQGHVTFGARLELVLNRIQSEKSLPDHWKYKRLAGVSSDKTTDNDAPRQKQRQKQKKTTPLIPPELDTPEFREAWAEWQQHKRERRNTLTPTGARRALKKLAAMGPVRAVAAIHHSVASNYQGIFEPKGQSMPSGNETVYERLQREKREADEQR